MTPETPILHQKIPYIPWMEPNVWRLPGTQPTEQWLVRDEVFEQQMELRDHLIATAPDRVHALMDEACDAANECLDLVLDRIGDDPAYQVESSGVTRPDGANIEIDRDAPLLTLGRLVQEDMCILQPGPDGHRLTGAILCFPASWTLAEKIGKPLMAIHTPVPEYDEALGQRVQRMFDRLQPSKMLWRANAIRHEDPSLFHPRLEDDPLEVRRGTRPGDYIRSERQTLQMLPKSRAAVFTIHTYVLKIADLPTEARSAMAEAKIKSG